MKNMKLQLMVVAFWALVQTYGGLSCDGQDQRLSPDWKNDASVERAVPHTVGCLQKRSKAFRFYGLMGKRSESKQPFIARRKKGEMFVGVMGRMGSDSESLTKIHPSVTTATRHQSVRANEQGSQKDWIRTLH